MTHTESDDTVCYSGDPGGLRTRNLPHAPVACTYSIIHSRNAVHLYTCIDKLCKIGFIKWFYLAATGQTCRRPKPLKVFVHSNYSSLTTFGNSLSCFFVFKHFTIIDIMIFTMQILVLINREGNAL